MVETRTSLAALSLLLILACSPSAPATSDTMAAKPADTEADKAAVTQARDVLEGSYRNSDCNAMVSAAASDGVFDPPNTPSAKGGDAIRAWCEPLFTQMKTKSLTVSNKEIDVSGDIAVERGEYDWTLAPAKGGADVRAVGRYITVWGRQSDGSWKAKRLIWNSSEAAPRA